MSNSDKRAAEHKGNVDSEDVRPFSSLGGYQPVYDLILELPFYRRAMDVHMQWIRAIEASRPLIIDAGGGSGIMSAEAMRVRPDADVYLFDINPAMAKQAKNRGMPSDKIIIVDIASMSVESSAVSAAQREALFRESDSAPSRMRLKSESVDHILSHSVLWALPHPGAFFAEAGRVLRRRGTLAVSTVSENMHLYRRYFLEYLDHHISAAVRRGAVSLDDKKTFLQQNELLTEVAKAPLSTSDLRELGEKAGFVVEVLADCYVVDTPDGPRPYFYQVLFRKTDDGAG